MRGPDFSEMPALPSLTIGNVTFYNVRTSSCGGFVQFLISASGILRDDDLIQNGAHPVTMDRRAWDSMAAALAGKAAA